MDSFRIDPLNLAQNQTALSVKSGKSVCKDCNSEYCIVKMSAEYQLQNKLNPYRRYHCDQCKKSYSTISSLREHKKSHVQNKRFGCDFCLESFNVESDWKKHLLQHNAMEKLYECRVCARRFTRKSNLRAHRRVHRNDWPRFKCNRCEKDFRYKSNLNAHLATHPYQKFVCELCGNSFITMDRLQKHKRLHGNEARQCRFCNKAFSSRYKMNYHIRLKHKNIAPWQCTLCTESFPTVAKYRSHIYEYHDASKPYSCKKCDRSFQTKYNLDVHEAKHGNGTHFECDYCGHQFLHKGNLYTHIMRLHFQNNGLNDNSSSKSLIENVPTPSSSNTFDRRRYVCKKCQRCFVYKMAAINCQHKETRAHLPKDINNGINDAASFEMKIDEKPVAAGEGKGEKENGGGEANELDGMKVKISLVSENQIDQIIPLYELNIPAVDSTSTTIDNNNSKPVAFDIGEHSNSIEPIILVQAFTAPLDAKTANNSIKPNDSIDISNEVDSFEVFCNSLAPEIIVIDDSSDDDDERLKTFPRASSREIYQAAHRNLNINPLL